MKTYIVFTAFLIVFSMFMVYTSDMNRYIYIQKDLKALAEDCAEAGALCMDEKNLSIDPEKADSAALEILSGSRQFSSGIVTIEKQAVTREGKGYEITLLYSSGDLFRLPFLTKTEVRRSSEYAWE